MATLVLSAVGTILGGPIGGAIGALVGQQVDAAIIGSPRQEGPRLKELATTTSSYGAPVPRHFGRMRVPGTIIWATDLVEHSDTSGGGKGKPKVTTYSYSASFAVALSSRRIIEIGRIWADGNLLRGADGLLKTTGAMRVYLGDADQPADPLMMALESEDRCPAYRGLAYVVFEDLDLGDFFNRIPALTFEVIADVGELSLRPVVEDIVDQADADVPLAGLSGFACEGSVLEALRQLEPMFPLDCDACGERLTIARERQQSAPLLLAPPARPAEDSDFGRQSGFARKRQPPPASPPEVLRYYDLDRDYQPGVQRASGRPSSGQPRTVELAAALTASAAREIAERMARRSNWARESLAWRSGELNPDIAPGSIVTAPGQAGQWRVRAWEWREGGVEFGLERVIPALVSALPETPVDPGRSRNASDNPSTPTWLTAFELPWDGIGNGDTPAPFAAVSSSSPNWSGAALFVDHGDGALHPIGTSGRQRSVLGSAVTSLPPASPTVFDRTSALIIDLIDPALQLFDATGRQLAQGANRALIGNEIVQFARAEPLGNARWQLRLLLRGRGGTEAALGTHTVGEPFVLLNASPVALDPAQVGDVPGTQIVALGRGDAAPVASSIILAGITRRPLSPVHARCRQNPDGSLALAWTRRARGAWQWNDSVDAPLHEQTESYRVTLANGSADPMLWVLSEPRLEIPAATVATLAALIPGGSFSVRQQGSYALSDPLPLMPLP
jgi:Putative phage tail protein